MTTTYYRNIALGSVALMAVLLLGISAAQARIRNPISTAPTLSTTNSTATSTFAGALTIGTTSPTFASHALTFTSTTNGLSLYNTLDQATNFERLSAFWTGNVAWLAVQNGGAGNTRSLRIGAPTGSGQTSTPFSYLQFGNAGTFPRFQFSTGTETSAGTVISYSSGLGASSAVTQVGMALNPIFTQTGSAAYSILQIQPTETTVGTGIKNLIQAGTSTATSLFTVSSTGITGIGTTTFNGMLGIGTYGSTNGTSTVSGGKLQWDGYNSAGSRVCLFIVGTTVTVGTGACNQ